MKLNKHSLIDDQFVTAEIVTEAGIITLEAEIPPVGPIHIERAIWKGSESDAMDYVSEHLGAVRETIREALTQSA